MRLGPVGPLGPAALPIVPGRLREREAKFSGDEASGVNSRVGQAALDDPQRGMTLPGHRPPHLTGLLDRVGRVDH